jgi:hypothetical protein
MVSVDRQSRDTIPLNADHKHWVKGMVCRWPGMSLKLANSSRGWGGRSWGGWWALLLAASPLLIQRSGEHWLRVLAPTQKLWSSHFIPVNSVLQMYTFLLGSYRYRYSMKCNFKKVNGKYLSSAYLKKNTFISCCFFIINNKIKILSAAVYKDKKKSAFKDIMWAPSTEA